MHVFINNVHAEEYGEDDDDDLILYGNFEDHKEDEDDGDAGKLEVNNVKMYGDMKGNGRPPVGHPVIVSSRRHGRLNQQNKKRKRLSKNLKQRGTGAIYTLLSQGLGTE